MTTFIQGNFISFMFPANSPQPDPIQLPDGYTYESVHIILATNIFSCIHADYITNRFNISTRKLSFPCYLQPTIMNTEKPAELKFLITKFGQIPDMHYFDKAFDPILITGEDGNEYNVIPSDQFK